MGQYVSRIWQEPNVQSWLQTLNNYAYDSFNSANEMAGRLSVYTGTLLNPSYDPPDVSSTNITLTEVESPNIPRYVSSRASAPSEVSTENINHIRASVPVFTGSFLDLNLPNLPTVTDPTSPIKPIVDLDKEFPDLPDATLPDAPVLIDIDLPTLAPISFPDFNGTLPVDNIVVPGNTFYFNEELYSDELLTKVKDELLIRLSDGTGIEPSVELAIWNRGRDREHTASLQAERSLLVESAQTGFTRPPGSVRAALDRLTQDTQAKIIELSREIMIKQADLEQENIKTSIQQTIALQDILIRNHNSVQERSFSVAKYIQDIAIELYNASIAHYNLKLEAYKTEASVFNTLIQAELSKVEVYKAELEAQALISSINKQYIDIYNASILAIKTSIDMYNVQVQAISEQISAEATKIEVYKAEVQAYSEEINANTQKYVAYGEAVRGEATKSEINKTQVDMYASQVQAYATEQGTHDSAANLEIEANKLTISKYVADLDGYIKQVQADQLNFQSQVDLFRSESSLYNAKSAFNTASTEFALKSFESEIQQAQFSSNKALENIKINADVIKAENQNRLAGMQASGSIYAQIASSSLNAINVSASNSSSLGNSLNESYNLSGEI